MHGLVNYMRQLSLAAAARAGYNNGNNGNNGMADTGMRDMGAEDLGPDIGEDFLTTVERRGISVERVGDLIAVDDAKLAARAS